MARRLDQMLQPGERVVFETGWRWRRVGRVALWSAGIGGMIGVIRAIEVVWNASVFEAHIAVIFVVLSALLFAAFGPLLVSYVSLFFFATHGATAVVTDMRVLYRSDPLSRRVVEIPLWHIQRLDRLSPVVVRDRSGKCTALGGFYDRRGLATAIRCQTGAPGPAVLEGKLGNWAALGRVVPALFAMASMLLAAWSVLAHLGIPEPATAELADGAGREALLPELVTFMLIVMAGILPTMFAGFTAGMLLLTLAMRAALPAGEAWRVLRACEDHWCYDPAPPSSAENRLDKLDRWPHILARRLASRLYGERV